MASIYLKGRQVTAMVAVSTVPSVRPPSSPRLVGVPGVTVKVLGFHVLEPWRPWGSMREAVAGVETPVAARRGLL